ncbi:MAG TPA: type II secretion system protein [Candidatus Paceibacterota bacterium]
MKGWYTVSLFGWLVALVHLALCMLIIHGLIVLNTGDPAWYLFNGASLINAILFVILVVAKLKKHRLFAANTKKNKQGAFTLVELLIVVSIIALLARFILPAFSDAREQARFARATMEFDSVHKSLNMYRERYGDYPADANRDIPPGLEEFLAADIWPDAAWPGSVFDWDNWEDPDNPGERIMQISVRFCPVGQPTQCKFPETSWAEDFDINSAVYYCIQGACRSHIDRPQSHPGYCVNCANN